LEILFKNISQELVYAIDRINSEYNCNEQKMWRLEKRIKTSCTILQCAGPKRMMGISKLITHSHKLPIGIQNKNQNA